MRLRPQGSNRAPSSAYTTNPQRGPYAPPPGPPPQWRSSPLSPPPNVPQRLDTTNRPSVLRRSNPSSNPTTAPQVAQLHQQDVQRMFDLCQTAKTTAEVLHEAIAFAKPEDNRDATLIEEFRNKCHKAHERISDRIPWAYAAAERSRLRSSGGQQTREEILLEDLLATNTALTDSLRSYDELIILRSKLDARPKSDIESKMQILDAITRFVPSEGEVAIVDRLIGLVGGGGDNIDMQTARIALERSGLPSRDLDRIWLVANVEESDTMGKHCLGVAVRLVGFLQHGTDISLDLLKQVGPLAVFDESGLSANSSTGSTRLDRSPVSQPESLDGTFPPMTHADRSKFMRIFVNGKPKDGYLDRRQARQIMSKSRLAPDVLDRIWNLADIRRRGVLDASAFTIAMYLIQAHMSGRLISTPTSLPPSLYLEAAGLSSELQGHADAFFEALDERHQEFLDATTAKSHFRQTGLPQAILSQIWQLADIDSNGRLTRSEFTAALYLIQLAQRGEPLPDRLPEYLLTATTACDEEPAGVADLIDLDPFTEPIVMPVPTVMGNPVVQRSVHDPPAEARSVASPQLRISIPALTPSQNTAGPSTSANGATPGSPWPCTIMPTDKANSDKFFDSLDPFKQGFAEGDTAAPFFAKSGLPYDQLGKIWDLADWDHDGRLSREEFAVAMHLIRERLTGQIIPDTLPPPLIPGISVPASSSVNDAASVQNAPASPILTRVTSPIQALQSEGQRSPTPPPPYEEGLANIVLAP